MWTGYQPEKNISVFNQKQIRMDGALEYADLNRFFFISRIYGQLAEVLSPEILSYVARNFIVLNNILAFLLPFAVLVSSDRRLYNEIY